MIAESAATAFGVLRQQSPSAREMNVRDSGLKIDGVPIQHAIDSDGHGILMVPISFDEPDVTDSASRGIRLNTHTVGGELGHRYMVLRCEDDRLEGQFVLLVDDVVAEIELDPITPGATLVRTLDKWRSLFQASDLGLLSVDAQLGLLAELHLLEQLMLSGEQNAIALWTGPDRTRHDFVGRLWAVEVKATTGREAFRVAIHGAWQLDAPDGLRLSLYAEQLEPSANGDSIAMVVERLIEMSVDSLPLLKKLKSVGYSVADKRAYESFRFALLRAKLIEVSSDFPRLSRATLRDELILEHISRLNYSVDIGSLTTQVPDARARVAAAEVLTS